MLSWKETFSVGDELIDIQHKDLINSVNIIDELKYDKKSQAIEFLKSLREMMVEHFKHELEYMQEMNFPKTKSHNERHNQILQGFSENFNLLMESKTKSEFINCIYKFSIFMRDDIISHTIGEDQEYHLWQINSNSTKLCKSVSHR